MPNIKDVAKRAGVSIATVSNVFSGTTKVKDTTKARVLRAATELNYNGTSGGELIETAARTIGVIAEDVTIFNTPGILSAICRAARQRGWEVLIDNLGIIQTTGTYDFDELECSSFAKRSVNLLLSNRVDGIIYVGCQSREIRSLSAGYDTPFVYAYCFSNRPEEVSIVYDDQNAAYELTCYLIENGHGQIGIITGQEDNIHVRSRLVGIQKAHFEAGILYNPNNNVKGDWNDPQTGYRCMAQLKEQKVSAVFCMNDVIAAGVYKYALESGIRIPGMLSVVGFDDQVMASVLYPGLTTIALPLDRIGLEAIARLEGMLSGNEVSAGVMTLGCQIIYRESVARLK